MKELETIFDDLRQLGLVRSQYDFSRDWLGQSESYYSSLKARKGKPSAEALLCVYLMIDGILYRLDGVDGDAQVDECRGRLEEICQCLWLEMQERFCRSERLPIFHSGFMLAA